VVQKRDDVVGRQVLEVEFDDVAIVSLGEEAQEERDRIAIAAHRVGAHAADPRQMIGEELAQGAGERA
jgi:hypothetical protein